MANGTIKMGAIEHTNIATGADAYKIGRMVLVLCNGCSSNLSFPAELRPRDKVTAMLRGTTSNSTRHACLITFDTDGAFSVSYFVPNTTTAGNFNGTLNGQFTYLI